MNKVIPILSLVALAVIIPLAACRPSQSVATEAEASETPKMLIDHDAAMEAFMGGPAAQPTGEGERATAEPSPQATSTKPSETIRPIRTAQPTQVPQGVEPAPQVGDMEVVYSGIERPHGIGVVGDVVYVSSEAGVLHKIEEGAVEPFVKLNFPHDMIAMSDGSLITPVFLENRLVRVGDDGTLTELAKGLSGPNGIVEDGNGNFYVSNYFAGTVVWIGADLPLRTIATRLNGPAGVGYDPENNTLYVAEYLGNRIAVMKGDQRDAITLSDLVNVESLFVNSEGKLLATAALNGQGVVVEVKADGDYEILISTDLPAPLVGHFTRDGYVYLVSPNDPEGRVLRVVLSHL